MIPGLSWMPSDAFRREARAAWNAGRIGALEVTLEPMFRPFQGGDAALVADAEARGWLLGHGVHYSVLSPTWTARDADWLARVAAVARRHRFRWVSEHLGCLRAGGVDAAPVPVPYTDAVLGWGRDRLARLVDAVRVPVGLENLALAWSADDAVRQADLLDALLAPIDGFMVLDLHNLWCQAVNYGLDPIRHLERQPVERVRQVHVSGGSWSEWPEGTFRRDTHDGPVPGEVWALLAEAIARCPRLEVVTLERLGPPIDQDPSGWAWEIDALATVCSRPISGIPVTPPQRRPPGQGDPGDAIARVLAATDRSVDGLRRAGRDWLADADPRALRTVGALLDRYAKPNGQG